MVVLSGCYRTPFVVVLRRSRWAQLRVICRRQLHQNRTDVMTLRGQLIVDLCVSVTVHSYIVQSLVGFR